MGKKIGAVILGGTGYGAGELLRLFTQHPNVEVASVVSSSRSGSPVTDSHPHLLGFYDFSFEPRFDVAKVDAYDEVVVFAALPHGTSAKKISALVAEDASSKLKIIDLSGDFRLRDEGIRKKHYPGTDAPESLREQFVYGLTEFHREDIKRARFVSNPGCLSSACILAAAPVVHQLSSGQIIFDAKTGTSGAGKSPQAKFHHPEQHGNADAYKVLVHRHEPEIAQELFGATAKDWDVSFVPHVIPTARGIYASAYIGLQQETSTRDLLSVYEDFYRNDPFIRVRKDAPHLRMVVGSNFCDLNICSRGKQAVAFAALDNLVKGMTGQAIQNMNLMCGLPEETGLWQPALCPV